MTNLHAANSANTSSLIGALELTDYLGGLDDGLLEAAGANMALGSPTMPNCGPPPTLFRCIGDDALLRAADTAISGPPPTMPPFCRFR